ncbi:MAG: hypothetical protein ABIZ50_04680 [Solirubrobacterales bacterium]
MAALASLAGATTVSAAPYTVLECSSPFGAPDASPFDTSADHYLERNRCDSAGAFVGLTVTHSAAQTELDRQAGWSFSAPDGTYFTHADFKAYGNQQDAHVPQLYMRTQGVGDFLIGSPDPTPQFFDWNSQNNGGAGSQLVIQLKCRGVSAGNCGRGDLAYVGASDFRFVLEDAAAPSVLGLDGSLFAAPATYVKGLKGLALSASDRGSGLAGYSVAVNGQDASAGTFGQCLVSDGVPVALAPCPSSGLGAVALDTGQAPFQNGLNDLDVCVSDFAGSETCAKRQINVDRICPVNEDRAVTKLAGVGFNRKTPSFGKRVKLVGRAVGSEGKGRRSVRVCVTQSTGPNGQETLIGTPKTNGKGHFEVKLARGASRSFRIAAWQGDTAVSKRRTLLVKAKPKLALRPKGEIAEGHDVRFLVRLNPPITANHLPVRVESKALAGWVSVPGCTGQANGKGLYKCKLHFPEGSGGVRYRFRAFAGVGNDGYPFLRGHSRVLAKMVRH